MHTLRADVHTRSLYVDLSVLFVEKNVLQIHLHRNFFSKKIPIFLDFFSLE